MKSGLGSAGPPMEETLRSLGPYLMAQHTELCSMLPGSRGGRKTWGSMGTRMCLAESLRCASGTIAWLIGYTPI